MLKVTPHYPKSNEQAESSNKTVANEIKRFLKAKKGKWAEELYHICDDLSISKSWRGATTNRFGLVHSKSVIG